MRGLRNALIGAMICAGSSILAEPEYHVGAGTISCGKWVMARQNANDKTSAGRDDGIVISNMGTSWIQGYLTGQAVALSDSAQAMKEWSHIPDVDALNLWVENYCRANPLRDLMDTAATLHREINR